MACQFDHKRARIEANLVALYSVASAADIADGLAWYPRAHTIVREWAEHFDLPIACVASIVAAISPQCEWPRNLIIAEDVLRNQPQSVGGALHVNVRKARRIFADRATDITAYFPCGPKVASFAVNLAGDYSHATIDTHAMQAALNDVLSRHALKPKPYTVFAECYACAARSVGLEPAHFQAVLWHTWKRLHPRVSKLLARREWVPIGTED